MKPDLTNARGVLPFQDESSSEDVIDRIMKMVDDRVDDVDSPPIQAPVLPKKSAPAVIQPAIVKPVYPSNQCWHFDYQCNNPACYRLHMRRSAIDLGIKYVHRHQDEYPNMNQLCDQHFNDESYRYQRMSADQIEKI